MSAEEVHRWRKYRLDNLLRPPRPDAREVLANAAIGGRPMRFKDIAEQADKSSLTLWGPDDALQRRSHVNGYCIGYVNALEDIKAAAESLLTANRKVALREHWCCIFYDDLAKLCSVDFDKKNTGR